MPVPSLNAATYGDERPGQPSPTELIRAARGPRHQVARDQPVASFSEQEIRTAGQTVTTQVVILGGAECRFTCAMCDLWRNTTISATPPGVIPAQIREAVAAASPDIESSGTTTGPARWIKLYNGSNFFDVRNVPREDLPEIAQLVRPFERIVVENHPRLMTAAIPGFRDQCYGRLEVAMGLECTHPDVLPRLNKQMTLTDFTTACHRLHGWGVDTRAFVLLGLPWLPATEAVDWCVHAVRFAWAQGVRHVSVVPTRPGNGFLDQLAGEGLFQPPTAAAVEAVVAVLLESKDCQATTAAGDPQLVTVDLWDWPQLAGHCGVCSDRRRDRLAAMNCGQHSLPPVESSCGCTP